MLVVKFLQLENSVLPNGKNGTKFIQIVNGRNDVPKKEEIRKMSEDIEGVPFDEEETTVQPTFITRDYISTAQLDVTSGYYYLWFDLATLGLVDGGYIATATAQNEWGVSGLSNDCPFTKVVPNNPPNLRVSGQ